MLPVAISIDCEPDQRVTPGDRPPLWNGMAGTIQLVETLRKQIPQARFGWYWRADAQVERGHGDAAWALTHYRCHIERTMALGDEHGIHPHPWRWNDGANTWISDAADEDWMEHCIRGSIESFTRTVGEPVRVARMGDGHMSPRIMQTLAKSGVLCDMTLEPSAPATPSLAPAELATGLIPDRSGVPRRPYHPDALDPCCPASELEANPIWALPITTAPAGITGLKPGTAANLGLSPVLFRRIISAGRMASAAQGASYISAVVRSDVGTHPGLARYTAENLTWLATTRFESLATRFVAPLELLPV